MTMTDDNITDDDKNLFRECMRNVTPLKQTNSKQPPVRKVPPIPAQPRASISTQPTNPHPYLSNHYTEEVYPNTILSYHITGIPKKRLIELKNGEIRWQGRLDLHGNTIPQAQDKLCQFITQQYQLGHRCVLMIHGKGSPTGEAPILKNQVNHWLKQLPEVLAFHSALPRDGGSGALYVLLRRVSEPRL